MTLPYKLRMIGRAERVRSWPEAQQQVDTIRAKIDELVKAVDNLSTNVSSGTSGGVLPHAVFTGAYGTAAVDGALNSYISSNATLPYPSALGVAASPITDMLTLSDDITEGALLTASNTFSVNSLALKAPNATDTMRIGKYGNISVASTTLVDTIVINFTKTDFNESTATPIGVKASITNTNTGTGSIIAQGMQATITGNLTNAGGASTNRVEGIALTVNGGAATNNNWNGTLRGVSVSGSISELTIGTAVTNPIEIFRSGGAAVTRAALTDFYGFRSNTPSVVLSGTITNVYGFSCDALTTGTNRIGYNVAAFTTGTPTVSYGVQVATHSVGTTRRSFIGGNSFHCTANDYINDTAAKGLISKDTQGTARYWRLYSSSSGTASVGGNFGMTAKGHCYWQRGASPGAEVQLVIGDVGTSLPTT